MYQWYCLVRQRNVPVNGPILQAEACLITEKLHQPEFKASNGWLQSFKNHYGLKQLTVSGEAADVQQKSIDGWFERLKALVQGYKLEDIWNEDETGCFYRALSDKTLAEKRKECRGRKRSKERLTVAFFANATGDKEPPIVLGKAAKPRCFKGIRNLKKPHGVPYYAPINVKPHLPQVGQRWGLLRICKCENANSPSLGTTLSYESPTNYPRNHNSMEKYGYSCCKYPYPGDKLG